MADTPDPFDQIPHNPVPEPDLKEAFKIPAVSINRMISNNLPNGMRLTFLEENSIGKVAPQVRAAILLSYEDALSLRNLITTQIERAKLGGFYVPSPATPKGN